MVDEKAGIMCVSCYTKDGHTDRCPLKPREDGKVFVALLGLNGGGPWMLFPFNEDMTGLLSQVQELQEDVIANEDELTIRYKLMTQEEIDATGEFPGW